ncbi:AAA family ATPase [Micromonospora rubida]|uniref:AAA family ATPase n=1 Tax=Micromonospora rubida TaxID=2697657 RepID=UPI001F43A9D2|nr:adenylate/guanylate cyclase domain-containing protein [Micromonospora rubida]
MLMSTIVTEAHVTAPADWPVPEERRTVSVLFADIVGSTALVDRLDPEEVRALQRAYFDTVAGVLARWGGVVEKYVGDAVMALFGARESDGFDAYRAVRAGLEIQRALDGRTLPGAPALRTRVGVATGEALVDVAALRDGAHGTASGAVITAAARLQEHAPPGAVVVCAATRRATATLIAHRALPPLTVAGKPLPMDVSIAAGVARPEPAGHHGRLVGRRRHLAHARDQVLRAVRENSPRWVSLVGPAGSGRSRMLHELRRAVDASDGTPVRWYVVACPPFPERPVEPVADLLRAFADVRAEDPPATVRRRLLAATDGLVPPVRALSTAVALEGLLDGSFPAGAVVWQRLLLSQAAVQPLVVAVDDLDRAAPAVTRFLRGLIAAAVVRRLPLAVVTTHRPEWADTRPGPDDRRDEVPLPPLSQVETGRLLRQLLARAGQPTALATRLLPLVGGLPGTAEAYARRIPEGADPAAALPDRVRASATARLDACDGTERAATMVVAALGPSAPATTVDQAIGWAPGRAEPVLRRLAGRGLLRRTARDGYRVADPALRRVAHDRLPRSVRTEIARRVDLGTPVGPRLATLPISAALRHPTLPISAALTHPADLARQAGATLGHPARSTDTTLGYPTGAPLPRRGGGGPPMGTGRSPAARRGLTALAGHAVAARPTPAGSARDMPRPTPTGPSEGPRPTIAVPPDTGREPCGSRSPVLPHPTTACRAALPRRPAGRRGKSGAGRETAGRPDPGPTARPGPTADGRRSSAYPSGQRRHPTGRSGQWARWTRWTRQGASAEPGPGRPTGRRRAARRPTHRQSRRWHRQLPSARRPPGAQPARRRRRLPGCAPARRPAPGQAGRRQAGRRPSGRWRFERRARRRAERWTGPWRSGRRA